MADQRTDWLAGQAVWCAYECIPIFNADGSFTDCGARMVVLDLRLTLADGEAPPPELPCPRCGKTLRLAASWRSDQNGYGQRESDQFVAELREARERVTVLEEAARPFARCDVSTVDPMSTTRWTCRTSAVARRNWCAGCNLAAALDAAKEEG